MGFLAVSSCRIFNSLQRIKQYIRMYRSEYTQTAYAICGLRGLSGYVHHAAAFQKRFIDSAPEAVEETLIVVGRSHTRRQRQAVFRSTIKTTISVVPRWRSG